MSRICKKKADPCDFESQKTKKKLRVRSSYYMEGAYIQAACDKLITSTSDGGYSNLIQ